jgi:hypothetical protein
MYEILLGNTVIPLQSSQKKLVIYFLNRPQMFSEWFWNKMI